MRKIYILPNLFTAGSLFCGMMAIFEVFDQNDVFEAVRYIFIAGVLDVLDGLIARLTRTQSSFGLNFDSLADVVSFGVAPALTVYTSIVPEFPLLAKATCGLFVVCGALRLARFNVQAAREEKKSFLGLPIPGAALAAVSLFWFLTEHPGFPWLRASEKILPVAMVVLAYLMVSQIQYYGFKSLRITGRYSFEILVSIVIILAVLLTLKQHIDIVLVAGFALYILHGPVIFLIHGRRAARMVAVNAPGRMAARTATKTATGSPRSTSPPSEH